MRRGKYNNKPTFCRAGHKHHSGAEARRCDQLYLLQRAGKITVPEQQPRFALHVGGIKIGTYIGDFGYFEMTDGYCTGRVIEDVKGGPIPPLSKWKIKHAEAEYKFQVRIVRT